MRGSADRSVHCDEMSIEGTRVRRCVPAISGDRLLRVRWGEISAQKGNPKPPRKAGLYAGRRLGDTGVALRRESCDGMLSGAVFMHCLPFSGTHARPIVPEMGQAR